MTLVAALTPETSCIHKLPSATGANKLKGAAAQVGGAIGDTAHDVLKAAGGVVSGAADLASTGVHKAASCAVSVGEVIGETAHDVLKGAEKLVVGGVDLAATGVHKVAAGVVSVGEAIGETAHDVCVGAVDKAKSATTAIGNKISHPKQGS